MAADPILSGRKVRKLTASDLGITASSSVPLPSPSSPLNLTSLSDEVGIDRIVLTDWLSAIRRKRQAIFFGPPGTGKTFLATRIADAMASEGDGFVETLQFHPSFAYEDFLEGRKPKVDDGLLDYPVVPGRFRDFCDRAAEKTGNCVLVIDEINRANLSQVLGELLYLLEYRGRSLVLPNSGDVFSIPTNVLILGTMNTADRSIAVADLALRRRFVFLRVSPDLEALKHYQAKRGGPNVDRLVDCVKEINAAIEDPNYALGQSYFMIPDLSANLESIWKTEVEPYLEEVFSDSMDRVLPFRWDKVKARLSP